MLSSEVFAELLDPDPFALDPLDPEDLELLFELPDPAFFAIVKFVDADPSVDWMVKLCFPIVSFSRYSGKRVISVEPSSAL